MNSEAPGTQPGMFLRTLEQAEAAAYRLLAAAGFAECEVAPEFESLQNPRGVALRSARWLHSAGVDARCCLIRSAQVEILNLMAFPIAAAACPVFASEIIVFGGSVRVAVIDHQAADPGSNLRREVENELQSLHIRHAGQLTGGGELPDWARLHFTPVCIYSRPSSKSETPLLCVAFEDYLNKWLEHWLPRASPLPSATPHLLEYQRHHIDNTPGRPFLSKTFGAEWTERYLSGFMYAPANTTNP